MPDTTTTTRKPLDAEREDLRAKGHTDEEISSHFVHRLNKVHGEPAGAATGGGSAPVAAQGVMSGVLSSFLAVVAYARDTIFTIRNDVETLFKRDASLSVRAGATASLAVKAALAGVLGFAAWYEWQTHVINAKRNRRSRRTAKRSASI